MQKLMFGFHEKCRPKLQFCFTGKKAFSQLVGCLWIARSHHHRVTEIVHEIEESLCVLFFVLSPYAEFTEDGVAIGHARISIQQRNKGLWWFRFFGVVSSTAFRRHIEYALSFVVHKEFPISNDGTRETEVEVK
jgi:hypothetical protein